MIHLGIDPGLDGALAILHDSESAMHHAIYSTPTMLHDGKRRYATRMMHSLLSGCVVRVREGSVVATIENVHAMPGQGVTSMFSMGYGLGIWHALLVANGILYKVVTPQSWKKHFALDRDKEKSRALAIEKFPGLAAGLARKKDHGRAEALLIAEYGRTKAWVGGKQ